MKFDTEIHRRLKADNRGYEGSKPSPQDWEYMLEEKSLKGYLIIMILHKQIVLHQRFLKTHKWIWIYHCQYMEKVLSVPN